MKDLQNTEDRKIGSINKFLNYINKDASRKNDVVMFGFIFIIIFYISVFVPNTPLGEQNSAQFTNTNTAPEIEQVDKSNTGINAKDESTTIILGSIK